LNGPRGRACDSQRVLITRARCCTGRPMVALLSERIEPTHRRRIGARLLPSRSKGADRMRRLSSALLATLLFALATPLFAQRTTGTISGVAKDASGAILPGATVSVSGENIVGSQTTTTNEQGYYRFLNLPPGDYVLKFALNGFRTMTLSGIRVGVGQTVEGNANLQVSQMEEAVDVVAESPVVDTSSNEVGANYDRSWVENAPL